MKLFTIPVFIAVNLNLCSTAFADSFCSFDEALIGTKAIGYISPTSLDNHEYDYETALCTLTAYEAPSETAEATIEPCTDFINVPSKFETNLPVTSEYYRLMIFDADELWLEISQKTGEKKWIKKTPSFPNNHIPYHYISDDAPASVYDSSPTQSGVYSEPRLDKPAQYNGQQFGYLTDSWIDYTIPLDFFSHEIFKILKTYGVFDPNHIEGGKLATHYGGFLYAGYDVKAIIKDKDGREWLKAEEYLTVSPHDFWGLIDNQIEAQGITLSEEERLRIRDAGEGPKIRSKAGQTVYFPYREPSGTITMVMTSGPDCD